MSTEPKERLVNGSFALVALAALSYFTAIGMLVPAIPHYVEDVLGGSSTAVGIVVGSFAVTAALLRPFVGRTGDRRGRRVLVMGGAAAVAVSMIGYAVATNLAMLIVARLVTGVGEAALFVGAATAAQDLAPDSRRGEAASYFSVAVYGGQGIGPLLSEWLRTDHGFGWVWAVAAALCIVAVGLGWWTPVGQLQTGERRPQPLLHPAVRGPGSVLFLSLMGFGGFLAFVSVYIGRLHEGQNAGYVFLLYSVVVLACRLLGARLADRRGPKSVAATGLVLIAAGLTIAAAWHAVIGVYVATVVLAPGVALQYPALISICLANSRAEERSAVVASFTLFLDVSQAMGLPVLGVIVGLTDERGGFAAGAVLALLALVVLRRYVEGGEEPLPPELMHDLLEIGPVEPEA